jgi:hypothetical protein
MSLNREKSTSEPDLYRFEPQEDITAYEIAQLLPVLVKVWKNAPTLNDIEIKRGVIPPTSEKDIEGLSESLRRHFHKT